MIVGRSRYLFASVRADAKPGLARQFPQHQTSKCLCRALLARGIAGIALGFLLGLLSHREVCFFTRLEGGDGSLLGLLSLLASCLLLCLALLGLPARFASRDDGLALGLALENRGIIGGRHSGALEHGVAGLGRALETISEKLVVELFHVDPLMMKIAGLPSGNAYSSARMEMARGTRTRTPGRLATDGRCGGATI